MPFVPSSGNIFDHHPTIIINTANCVGIMGAGVAKSVLERFPSIGPAFRALCGVGLACDGMPDSQFRGRKFDPLPPCLLPGGQPCGVHRMRPEVVQFQRTQDATIPWVGHLATKRHWNAPSSLADVESGIIALAKAIDHNQSPDVQTVAIPAPGCANGGLSWTDQVQPLILRHLAPVAERSHHIVRSYAPMRPRR